MQPLIRLPIFLRLIREFDFPRKLGICEQLFGARLEPHGVCWVKTAAGPEWKLDLAEVTHRWIVYGKYEGAAFLDWARAFLPPDGVVVDSGANLGQMVLYLAQWIPGGRMLAIEPGKEQADWLEECLRANPQLPVELIRAGLGNRTETLRLSSEGIASKHGAQNRISETVGESIPVIRLEDALAERGLTRVDLWKLDVEGFEIRALRGAEPLLRAQAINAIYAELHGDHGYEILKHLQGLGYTCHLFQRNGLPKATDKLPEHTNGLFLPTRC